MLLLTSLLIAHFVADFYLQPHAWVMDKVQHREKSFGLFKHICVHFVLTLTGILLCVATLTWEMWFGFAFIILSHYAIDIWKTYQSFRIKYFLIDQVGHYLVITVTTLWWLSLDNMAFNSPTYWFDSNTWLNIFVALLGLVFLYKPVALTQILILNALNLENNPNYQFDVQNIIRRIFVFILAITLNALFIIVEILIRVIESYLQYRKSGDVIVLRKQMTISVFNLFCVATAYLYYAVLTVE